MAIGIPLSSLDVVVGISGVHYVLQGMRQIDREMSAMSAKRVRVAVEAPDFAGQAQLFGQATNSVMRSTVGLAGSLRNLMNTVFQPIQNPLAINQARQVIQQYQQASLQARLLGAQAAQASHQASAAERQHLTVMRERNRLQGLYNRALNAQTTAEAEIRLLTARTAANPALPASIIHAGRTRTDIEHEIVTTTAAGIRNAALVATGTAAQAATALRNLRALVGAAEAQAGVRLGNLMTALPMMAGNTAARLADLNAGPSAGLVATMQAAAVAARNNATALQGNATAARLAAAGMAGAANGARQYLTQALRLISPLGYVRAGFTAVLGVLGSLISVGAGLVRFGGTVLGVVGHVGSLVTHFLRIPVVGATLTGGISLITDNFLKLAGAIGLVVSTLAGLTFKEILQEGSAFEQGMQDIASVALYTTRGEAMPGEDQRIANARELAAVMQELDYIVLKLGADTIFSNTQIASSIETMLRQGVAARDINYQSVRSVADLASATKSDIDLAAQAIAGSMMIFDATADETTRFADLIAGALNTSNMNITDFVNALRQVGPLASAIGIPLEDIITTLTMLGQKNYIGEIAGTSLRNFFLYMNPRTKPAIAELKAAGLWVDEGSTTVISEADREGYENALARYYTQLQNYQVQLRNYERNMADFRAGKRRTEPTMPVEPTKPKAPTGESTEQGRAAFFTAEGQIRPMREILQLLNEATKNMNDEQISQFMDRVFGKRSGAAALLLADQDMEQFDRVKAIIEGTTAFDAAALRLESVRGKMELLTGVLKSMASVVFMNWLASPLRSFLHGLIDPASRVLDWLGAVIEAGDELAVAFGGLTRGEVFFSQLAKGLQTGDLGSAWINMLRTLPEGLRNDAWATRLRTLMRWLQLGRDGFITFRQAVSGQWWGAATGHINSLVRVLGILGTYWGTVWRNVGQLLNGEITLRQFVDNVLGGFTRLVTEARLLFQQNWPQIQALLTQGWEVLKDVGTEVWNKHLKPALEGLWTSATEYLGSEETKSAVSGKLREWVAVGEGFWDEHVEPTVDALTASFIKFLDSEETKSAIGAVIGTTVSTAWNTAQFAFNEIPIDWKIVLGVAGIARALSGGVMFGVMSGVVGLTAALAPGIYRMEDEFNEFWERALDPSGKSGDPMDVFKGADPTGIFNNPIMKLLASFAAGFIMIGEMFGASLYNSGIFALQKLLTGFATLWDKLGEATGLWDLDQGWWDEWNRGLRELSQLRVNFDWAQPLFDRNGDPDQQAVMGRLFGPAAAQIAAAMVGATTGTTPTVINGAATGGDALANVGRAPVPGIMGPTHPTPMFPGGQPSGQLPYGTSTTVINNTTYVSEGSQLVPEYQASPRRINPITGQLAPEGLLYIYNPIRQMWTLIPASYLEGPQRHPDTGRIAPEGYKYVLDAASGLYVLVPISATDVNGTVSMDQFTPEGMAWLWDPTWGTYKLVRVSQLTPPGIPPGYVGAPPDPRETPQNPRGHAGPGAPPTPQLPSGGSGPLESLPNETLRTAPTAVIQVDATGLTDEMFLNKLADRLEAKWRQLNGLGSMA